MGSKQSAEMREALRLVSLGTMTNAAAAAKAGVRRESLQAVLAKLKSNQEKVKCL